MVGETVIVGLALGTGTGVKVGRFGIGWVAMTPTVMLPSLPQPATADNMKPTQTINRMVRTREVRLRTAGRIVNPTSASGCLLGYSVGNP